MRVAFIWHMHQPYYKDLKTGEYLMPWVRLHGSKDYLDMLLLLDEFPKIKQTFNLVPSLLEQLSDYVENGAADRHLVLSRKRSSLLSDEEKIEIIENFFSAYYPTMIKPYPRYNDLYHKCREKRGTLAIHGLSDQEFLDLQVWSNAVWIDPTLRKEKKIRAIYRKGKDFTEEEKNLLLDYQIGILRDIIPAYQERRKVGRIEVSFSPYYHPILPLLVDTDSARMALPNITLPPKRFAHPEDADSQVAQAAELYRTLFGGESFGMWPSEGSVSEAVLPILRRHGVRWLASDEEIYAASISHPQAKQKGYTPAPEGFHRPYSVGDDENTIGILFRDHRLSDKIGFVYSSWDAEKGAADFVNELHKLSEKYDKLGNEALVSIILDGENAWEYYRNDGIDFLRALYRLLERDEQIQTVLPSEVFPETQGITRLPFLFSGSWINHNFRVWIGHDEDNLAWDLLGATRDALVEFLKARPDFDPRKAALAWKDIYVAEGSDWCWWYGDEHHTEYFEVFDYLFRKHLQNVWEMMGIEPPIALMQPIRKEARQTGLIEPTDLVTPIIDGIQSNYFEWFGAGKVECRKMGGTMHRAGAHIYQILYGYDDDFLYFRFDFEKELPVECETNALHIELIGEERLLVVVGRQKAQIMKQVGGKYRLTDHAVNAACSKLVEVAVPRDALAGSIKARLYFSVTLKEGEKVVERWPEANYILMELPKRGETLFWQV